jgi:hypothetical protein
MLARGKPTQPALNWRKGEEGAGEALRAAAVENCPEDRVCAPPCVIQRGRADRFGSN